MLTSVFLISALTLGLSIAFQIFERRLRAKRFQMLELKPNCLLTRYPIVFLSGPRTVFRLFDHWNSVPLYLREHGYEVYVIEPSGSKRTERTASVLSAIESLGRCHLIADGSLEQDLEDIASLRPLGVASSTVVKTPDRSRYKTRTSSISPRDLRPSLVESFTIHGSSVDGWMAKSKLVLLMAHNFLIQKRTLFVHPFETAEISPLSFENEARFLDLAIILAERDVSGVTSLAAD
jgi:hypothetical protein